MRKSYFVLFFFYTFIYGQRAEDGYFDLMLFRGSVMNHAPDINHLITGHPRGLVFSYNFKTTGTKEWEQAYNYPDYGVSFLYQDFENEFLGKVFSLNAHYNFFFFKRRLMLRISQGVAMTTNPYDKELNFKNNAFGTRFMSSNYFLLQYQKERWVGPVGIQTGLFFTHFSNGRVKSPNRGINTFGVNVGLNYALGETPDRVSVDTLPKVSEPLKYNLVLRTGLNQSSVVGSKQYPFYHFGAYVDKRISRKSALQLGGEFFITESLKEHVNYLSVAYPEKEVNPNTDYKRVSLFVGHELFINNLSIEAQVGTYVYKPFKLDADVYQRLGLKYYILPKLFTGVALKSHGAKAEAIEWAIGVRL
ncbi:MAG: acyloxyacyl hydrolase [Flavobacterium sp.]